MTKLYQTNLLNFSIISAQRVGKSYKFNYFRLLFTHFPKFLVEKYDGLISTSINKFNTYNLQILPQFENIHNHFMSQALSVFQIT